MPDRTPVPPAIDPSRDQRLAADPAVSAWVNASAGSGKTKVLTDRVLALLLAGARPHGILCLTFTKAAAGEMANRVADRLALWARVGDAELARHLADLLGAPPDADTLDRARRLFARVQEAPGGVRIDTVHAFCQGVLQRFPVEARVPPHFAVLEDRDQRLLLVQARDRLVRAVTDDPAGPLAVAWDRVLARLSETGFARLAAEIAANRSRLAELTAKRVAAALGIAPDATPEAVLRTACADGAFDAEALRAAIAPLAADGTQAPSRMAEALDVFLATPAERRDLQGYAGAFLRKDGPPLALGRMKVFKNVALRQTVEAEQDRLVRVFGDVAKATALADTSALLTVAGALLAHYEALKQTRTLLDYDDLILGMRALLIDPGAAWVHYKLDRGIDHVLVDEAQDTNPAQWQVIARLVAEFFAGEGVERGRRTLFAVGDPKQSIYSFQGADPAGFIQSRVAFRAAAEASGQEWRDVPLTVSFRSAAPVLRLVDAVFRVPQSLGVGDTPVSHTAHRREAPGRVEVWPLLPPSGADAIDDVWQLPRDYEQGLDAEDRLAHAVAHKIRDLIASGETLDATDGRPIRAGDIMVLVRRRRRFGRTLVLALKRLGVPVAGVDRMALARQLAVQDLVAFGQFLLMPEDDLTLATVLKGPFFRWSDERLFALAHGRTGCTGRAGRTGSLWRALQEAEADRADAARLAGWLRVGPTL
ncbi:MAG: UvrD-helicase domain-containing protein, partial [Alphaproteobacteria bacterium]|nr:UvrD-helicase domain-containing protein [Alphaproteobacteria bacterium]